MAEIFAKSVLVTGSNRGVGLEFIKQLASRTHHLFAACRLPEKAAELQKLAEAYKHIVILQLDVTNEEEIFSAAKTIREIVGDQGLNCVINNAAMMVKEDDIQSVTADSLKDTYATNTIGPVMVIKAFLPLLQQASSINPNSNMSVSTASILNISSKGASIGDNRSGKAFAYRMSKAAMNMLTMNLSIELKKDKILVASIHPGWVLTDMGGPNALIDTVKSVIGMLKVAAELTEKDSGMFYGWNGEKIPW